MHDCDPDPRVPVNPSRQAPPRRVPAGVPGIRTTSYAPPSTSVYPVYTRVPTQTYDSPYQSSTTSAPDSSTYRPTTFSQSNDQTQTPQTFTATTNGNQDIYVSSTTPISVTIIDKNENANSDRSPVDNSQDIIYARDGNAPTNGQYVEVPYEADESEADQFQDELPPRGDVAPSSNYRVDQPDQFYHELPRARYSGPYQPPAQNVQSQSRGEPTERNYYGEDVTIEPRTNRTNNGTRGNQSKQERLIELYTGNGGISEVGQTEEQVTSGRYTNGDSSYRDIGNVQARVVSVTPPPENAVPSETVNTRRIVVSKQVETVREIEVPENRTNSNNRNRDRSGAYVSDNGSNRYRSNARDNYNGANGYNYDSNGYNSNGPNRSGASANYESSTASSSTTTGGGSDYYISTTTPATSSQRTIYVQPVSQEFAAQKAIPPAKK